jgi:hypothetical protein
MGMGRDGALSEIRRPERKAAEVKMRRAILTLRHVFMAQYLWGNFTFCLYEVRMNNARASNAITCVKSTNQTMLCVASKLKRTSPFSLIKLTTKIYSVSF